MQEYEYTTHYIENTNQQKVQELLNNYGREGWQLVGMGNDEGKYMILCRSCSGIGLA